MPHFSIPTCYFPSTALFVDDSHDFLLNFVLQLDESLAYRVFDSPFDALDHIHKRQTKNDHLTQRCLSEYAEAKNCPLTNHTINLDLATIHEEIYNPHRFGEISVVVVDYALAGMDGLEFCRRLENSNIRKILLTGDTDEKVVIEAFNQGLIHRYIQKSSPNVAEKITQSIAELQLEYFQSMSEVISRLLALSSASCLYNKKFVEFFQQFRQEKKIVEYYLVDNSGSFLLLDDDANASFLIVKNEADRRLLYDLALDSGACGKVLEQLASGEKLPCLWQAKAQTVDTKVWSASMLPAQQFHSEQLYYYAYVEGAVLFELRQKEIISYHSYLEELDAEELMLV